MNAAPPLQHRSRLSPHPHRLFWALVGIGTFLMGLAPSGVGAGPLAVTPPTTYSCMAGPFPTGEVQVTVALSAPVSQIAPGATAAISAEVSGLIGGPVGIEASFGFTAILAITVNGTPSTLTSSVPVTAAPLGPIKVPTLTGSVTAGPAGAIAVEAGTIRVASSFFDFPVVCSVAQGAKPAALNIPISTAPTTTGSSTSTAPPTSSVSPTTTPTGSTIPNPGSTTSTAPSPTAAPTTAPVTAPAASLPPAAAAIPVSDPVAQLMTRSATVRYTCTTTLATTVFPSETSSQAVTFRAADRVQPGSPLAVAMSLAPGLPNGPVGLQPGSFSKTMVSFGVTNANPSIVTVDAGPNTSAVAASAPIPVPEVVGNFTVSGSVGQRVDLRPGVVEFIIPNPAGSARCVPIDPPIVLSTEIVTAVSNTPVVAAATLERGTATPSRPTAQLGKKTSNLAGRTNRSSAESSSGLRRTNRGTASLWASSEFSKLDKSLARTGGFQLPLAFSGLLLLASGIAVSCLTRRRATAGPGRQESQ